MVKSYLDGVLRPQIIVFGPNQSKDCTPRGLRPLMYFSGFFKRFRDDKLRHSTLAGIALAIHKFFVDMGMGEILNSSLNFRQNAIFLPLAVRPADFSRHRNFVR